MHWNAWARGTMAGLLLLASACMQHGKKLPTGTYTVQFRMPVDEGTPVEFMLFIDGDDLGFFSNEVAPSVVDVRGLTSGHHKMELRQVTFYRGLGIKDEPHTCTHIFHVNSATPRQIWVRSLGTQVTCGVR